MSNEKRGRFAPGQSGNPNGSRGRALVAAQRSNDVVRLDDWQNYFTGQGGSRDKRTGSFFAPNVELSFDQLMWLWLGDDLAARAVETLPREALREDFDLNIADLQSGTLEDTGGVAPADLAAAVLRKLERLGAKTGLETCAKYERAYGGGALLIGANDGRPLDQPLDIGGVMSLDYLTPLEPRSLTPLYAYVDPTKPCYGDTEIYQLVSRQVLPSRTGFAPAMTNIHESRLLVFPGIVVSQYQQIGARNGWGEAMLNRLYRILRDFNGAWSSAGQVVNDFAQSVIKIAGLWAALAQDGQGAFRRRLEAMDQGRSTVNAITIDAGDSYERQQTPITGLPDLLEKFATRLAAACDMPLTLLFGTSPAGMNATGESDIRFFYDRVAAYRERVIAPKLRRLCRIAFRTLGSRREPAKWSIEFRPLWQESAQEIAQSQSTQASADKTWIESGVLTKEEVAESHWGSGKYDPAIKIDMAARREAAAKAAEAEQQQAAAAGEALNGAQVSSMVEIAKAAALGEVPVESARALLQAANPTLPFQVIERIVPADISIKAATQNAQAEVVTGAAAEIASPAPVEPAAPPAVEPRADRADRSRATLLRKLAPSGKCDACGRAGELEIDHVKKRGWDPAALSNAQRDAKYWDEYDRGVELRALCRSCNASDGAKNKQPRGDSSRADYDPNQERASDGRFGTEAGDHGGEGKDKSSGGGGKKEGGESAPSKGPRVLDDKFLEKYGERLSRVADRVREKYPPEERYTDGPHAEAQAAIDAEIKAIEQEEKELAGLRSTAEKEFEDDDEALADLASADPGDYKKLVESLRSEKALLAEGLLDKEMPDELSQARTQLDKANAEARRVGEDLTTAQREAAQLVAELDALADDDYEIGGESLRDHLEPYAEAEELVHGDDGATLDEIYSNVERNSDFASVANEFESVLGRPFDDGDFGRPPAWKQDERADLVLDKMGEGASELEAGLDDSGVPVPASDLDWENSEYDRATYEKQYKEFQAALKEDREAYEAAADKVKTAYAEHQAAYKAKAEEVQSKLEELHAQQIEAVDESRAAGKALSEATAPADEFDPDEWVAEKIARLEKGPLADASDTFAEKVDAAREKIEFDGDRPMTWEDLDDEAREEWTEAKYTKAVAAYTDLSTRHEAALSKLGAVRDAYERRLGKALAAAEGASKFDTDALTESTKAAAKGTAAAVKALSRITGRAPEIKKAAPRKSTAKRKRSDADDSVRFDEMELALDVADAVVIGVADVRLDYDPNQERAEDGRFGTEAGNHEGQKPPPKGGGAKPRATRAAAKRASAVAKRAIERASAKATTAAARLKVVKAGYTAARAAARVAVTEARAAKKLADKKPTKANQRAARAATAKATRLTNAATKKSEAVVKQATRVKAAREAVKEARAAAKTKAGPLVKGNGRAKAEAKAKASHPAVERVLKAQAQAAPLPKAPRAVLESIAKGDLTTAAAKIDSVIASRGMVESVTRNSGKVSVKDATSVDIYGIPIAAVGYRVIETGDIVLSTKTADSMRLAAEGAQGSGFLAARAALDKQQDEIAVFTDDPATWKSLPKEARAQLRDIADACHDRRMALLWGRESISTFVHESVHGFSPMAGPGAYQGFGAQIEEITTEATTRRIMREDFDAPAPDHRTGSYAEEIYAATHAVARVTKMSEDRAWDTVGRASERFKRRTTKLATPDEMVAAFAADLAAESGSKASSDAIEAALREDLKSPAEIYKKASA